jgi:hypothetical protein
MMQDRSKIMASGPVNNLVDAGDTYRNKASECFDLARRSDGGADGTWNKFLTMAMLWLRLAEETERENRLGAAGRDGANRGP